MGKRSPLGVHLLDEERPPYSPDMARQINNLKRAVANLNRKINEAQAFTKAMVLELADRVSAIEEIVTAVEPPTAEEKE